MHSYGTPKLRDDHRVDLESLADAPDDGRSRCRAAGLDHVDRARRNTGEQPQFANAKQPLGAEHAQRLDFLIARTTQGTT